LPASHRRCLTKGFARDGEANALPPPDPEVAELVYPDSMDHSISTRRPCWKELSSRRALARVIRSRYRCGGIALANQPLELDPSTSQYIESAPIPRRKLRCHTFIQSYHGAGPTLRVRECDGKPVFTSVLDICCRKVGFTFPIAAAGSAVACRFGEPGFGTPEQRRGGAGIRQGRFELQNRCSRSRSEPVPAAGPIAAACRWSCKFAAQNVIVIMQTVRRYVSWP
jgi:hypothetical protein